MLKEQNFQRPEIEEGVLIFKYLWKHRVFAARNMAYIELQQRFWVKFLFEMGINAKRYPFLIEIRDEDMFLENGDVSFMDLEDRVVQ